VNSALTQNCDLFLSEYGEGTGTTRFLEIFNPTGNVVDLSIYRLGRCVNGCDINGILDFTDFSFPLDAVLLPGAVFTIAHPSSTAAILAVADTTSTTVVGNGDDAVALVKADGDVTVILDVVGKHRSRERMECGGHRLGDRRPDFGSKVKCSVREPRQLVGLRGHQCHEL
jgi:predicted extracellular nuclease